MLHRKFKRVLLEIVDRAETYLFYSARDEGDKRGLLKLESLDSYGTMLQSRSRMWL